MESIQALVGDLSLLMTPESAFFTIELVFFIYGGDVESISEPRRFLLLEVFFFPLEEFIVAIRAFYLKRRYLGVSWCIKSGGS